MLKRKYKNFKSNRKATFTVVSLLDKKPKKTIYYFFITIFITYFYSKIVEISLFNGGLGHFIILCLYLFTNYKIWNRYFKKIRPKLIYNRKLRYFIKFNNLYENEMIEHKVIDKYGREKKEFEKIIINSARIGFLENDNLFKIRAYKDADKFNDKMGDLDSGLSALFGEIDNKIDTIKYTDYIFKKIKDKRIIINNNDNKINNTVYLPLNNNLNWNILRQPHLLLAGTTGSGKTTFLNYLILEMKKMESSIYICDPKRSDLSSLKHYMGENFVASESNSIAKLTRTVKEEMESRFVKYKENADNFIYGNSFVDYKLKPIFIIFDELGAFRAGAEKKVFQETIANLTEIILKGREIGVFCILSTQQPNAQNIPTELRDNLSVRLGMGNMTSETYRMVFGDSATELQTINTIGAGYIFLDGQGWQLPKYFEAPYINYKNFDFIEELKKYK